jgi:transposase-like protein
VGRRRYPPEFRRRVLDLVEAGRKVAEIAGISGSAIRRSTRGDVRTASTAVSRRGLTTAEKAELVAARKRIRELEAELAVHRRATELLKGQAGPKGGSRPSR